MWHSEILASLNLTRITILSPGLEKKTYIKMFLQKYSNINACISVVGKMPKQHFIALFFSNPGDKFLIVVESRGQICPIVFTFFIWRILIY